MNFLRKFLLLLGTAASLTAVSVPAQTDVSTVLPNGRIIHPAGKWIPLAPFPFALAVRSDGAQIAIPSVGFPFALNVVDRPSSDNPSVERKPSGSHNDPAMEVHAGLAYSPDGELLYVATGDSGKIRAYRTRDWHPVAEVSLDGLIHQAGPSHADLKDTRKEFKGSFAATLAISADGKTIYALDQGNWRVVVIDALRMERLASIATGSYPFGIALSPDGARLYVTNTGLFEYRPIPGIDAEKRLDTGLHFPPFGYPSAAARRGAVVEGKRIPGLGDENSSRGSSLWTFDVRDRAHPSLMVRLRLGDRIREARGATVGGAAPTGVAAAPDAVFVALAHQDSLAKISPDGRHLLAMASLSPFTGARFQDASGRPLRGVMPSGVAERGGRIYVAESGINAVAVLDTASMHLVEHIPAGWSPSAVDLSPDGETLYVVNAKGKGTGPNGGVEHDPQSPTYIGSLEAGSLSVIALAKLPAAEKLTDQVIAGNTAAIGNRPPLPRLKHCFLIVRENRTYDEVLGDVGGANGDPALARYGLDGWAAEDRAMTHLKVTPNLHALANRFAMSDNFFVDSDVSADGHRWVLGIQPTPFFSTAYTSSYGDRRHAFAGEAPGRRALFGGADAPMPEDEPQFGSLWEHIAASGKGVLNYGEGLELEGNSEMEGSQPEGQRLFLNAPLPQPVYEATDKRYPTFNMGIPDQARVDEFERDFRRRLAAGTVPALIVIRLPNDHTANPRPGDGYPYRASFVADNDLALGRIIGFLSRTSIWHDSAVFVTEDDAQSGVDHVDAHRSVLLVASPWVRPGSVSHQHLNMGSITRAIDELLGLGAMNLEDALASEMPDIFDTQPHGDPFREMAADPRIFVPSQARYAKPKSKKEAAALRDADNAEEIRQQMERSRPTLRRRPDHD